MLGRWRWFSDIYCKCSYKILVRRIRYLRSTCPETWCHIEKFKKKFRWLPIRSNPWFHVSKCTFYLLGHGTHPSIIKINYKILLFYNLFVARRFNIIMKYNLIILFLIYLLLCSSLELIFVFNLIFLGVLRVTTNQKANSNVPVNFFLVFEFSLLLAIT